MNKTKIIAAKVIVGIVLLHTVSGLKAAEMVVNRTLQPLRGISFDIGAKRAVSYYVRDNSTCRLVLTIADGADGASAEAFSATRFEAAIPDGQATQYQSSEGQGLEFACQANAKTMSIKSVEQIAVAK